MEVVRIGLEAGGKFLVLDTQRLVLGWELAPGLGPGDSLLSEGAPQWGRPGGALWRPGLGKASPTGLTEALTV